MKEKSKEQLISENAKLRERVSELELSHNEFRRVEKELRESEERYKAFFAEAPYSCVLFDSELNYLDINQYPAQYLPSGIEKEDIIGRNMADVVPAARATGRYDKYMEAIGAEEQFLFTEVVTYPELGERTFTIETFKVGDGMGHIATDITELKRAEEEIRKLSKAVEQSSIAIMITDSNGDIEYVNRSFEIMTGHELGKIKGKNPKFLKSGQQTHEFYKDLWETIKSGKDWRGEFRNIKKNGELYWEQSSISPVTDDTGNISHFIAIKEDITDHKEMVEDLRIAKSRAEGADRMKSTFLASMSHEIRTPMNTVIGYTNLILQDELSKDHREYLNAIKSGGNLLLTLIDDILDISKIEAGELKVDRIPFSLTEMFKIVDSNARALITKKEADIALKAVFPGKISSFVMGDSVRLQQVLNNLISNAIKFTDSGTIEYGMTIIDSKTLEFHVTDTGRGVPPEKQQEIFEPFQQVDINDMYIHGGTGLGLAISKRLVEMMGGTIRLESRIGEDHGSKFYFIIPYIPTGEEEVAAETHSAPLSGISPGRILLVEDHIVNRKLAKKILEKLGYSVESAVNGREAVSIFKSDHSIALILMDKEMPEMDGLEATRQIRDIEEAKGQEDRIPIIALTAAAMKGDRGLCLEAGCNDYLTKPISFQKLQEMLSRYLGANK